MITVSGWLLRQIMFRRNCNSSLEIHFRKGTWLLRVAADSRLVLCKRGHSVYIVLECLSIFTDFVIYFIPHWALLRYPTTPIPSHTAYTHTHPLHNVNMFILVAGVLFAHPLGVTVIYISRSERNSVLLNWL